MNETITSIARILCPDAGTGDYGAAAEIAKKAVSEYNRITQLRQSREVADSLPIRQAIPAGAGGGRYYWRIATESGQTYSAAKDDSKGDKNCARRKAAELICDGVKVTELIPPDFDTSSDEYRQLNRSKSQPDGMTVRQREKKH